MIDPNGYIDSILSREDCIQYAHKGFIKDIYSINRKKEKKKWINQLMF